MPSYRPQSSTTWPSRPSRSTSTCVNGLPCGVNNTTASAAPRVKRICSTAFSSGSGFITIPGPPPYGTSSTLRCRSVVKSRRSWIFTSSNPRSTPRPITPSAMPASTIRGKIVTISNLTLSFLALSRARAIHVEQTLRGRDPNPLPLDVDLDANLNGQRNQHLAARALDFKHAARGTTDHLDDIPD